MDFSSLASALPKKALLSVDGNGWHRLSSGKVREVFEWDDGLLIVATDRISAFDAVMPNGVPGKGILLTQMSRFWFEATESIVENHLLPSQDSRLAGLDGDLPLRSMAVRRLRPLPVECVVRGYLAGSGWMSYRRDGSICGHSLPGGLREAERLPEVIFTPTTKAAAGHDEPIAEERCEEILGTDVFRRVREVSFDLYRFGHERSAEAGMILADTKFEFGLDEEGKVVLIDELLTPDSSRYWPADSYEPGRAQASYDKQYVRDFLEGSGWDKTPPAPALPDEVVAETLDRYCEAFKNLQAVRPGRR